MEEELHVHRAHTGAIQLPGTEKQPKTTLASLVTVVIIDPSALVITVKSLACCPLRSSDLFKFSFLRANTAHLWCVFPKQINLFSDFFLQSNHLSNCPANWI